MDHEVYIALAELNEKFDYIYKTLVDKGIIKEDKKEDKKDDN